MIKSISLLCVLLSLISVASAVGYFRVDYASNSPRNSQATGAYDQSDESESVTRSTYNTQSYNIYHGEYPSYQIRVRTYGDAPTTNMYITGDFVLQNATCTIPNYNVNGSRLGNHEPLPHSNLKDGGYTCNIYTPRNGKPGYIFISSLPAQTLTVIIIKSGSAINCSAPNGLYGTISFSGTSTQVVNGKSVNIKANIVSNALGSCLNCANTTNGGPCNDNNPCTVDTCGDPVWGCTYSARVCGSNQACNPNVTNGCVCNPGYGYIQDNPAGVCGFDSFIWDASPNTSTWCDDTYLPIYWKLQSQSFIYNNVTLTVNNFPIVNAPPYNRQPISMRLTAFDQYSLDPSTGTHFFRSTNITAVKTTLQVRLWTKTNCPANNIAPGSIYYVPAYYNWTASYGSGSLALTASIRVNSGNAPSPRSAATTCVSSINLQQTLVSSSTDSGIEITRWAVNISTTAKPVHEIELLISPEDRDRIVEFSGVSKGSKEGRFSVNDKRFANGGEVPAQSQLDEIVYVIKGSEPAEMFVERAVCSGKCSTHLVWRFHNSHVENGRFTKNYVAIILNDGDTINKNITFEATLADESYEAEMGDFEHTTSVKGSSVKFNMLANIEPGQDAPFLFSVSTTKSNQNNFVEPIIKEVHTEC